MSQYPYKTSYNYYSSTNLPSTLAPPSPRTVRTLRKIQSSQALSSNHPSLIAQQRLQQQLHRGGLGSVRDYGNRQQETINTFTPGHGRTRSNSDAALAKPPTPVPVTQRRARSRKRPSKRLTVEVAVRDGPPRGNITEGLSNIRDSLLRDEIDADGDGMSSVRIYIWLILLNAPALPTDTYLDLVHRGPSPAYSKIRNDTFRTLATDPLFKRRVTESSLIRLLNAVAWKLHDSKQDISSRDPLAALHLSPCKKHTSLASNTSGSDNGLTSESGIYVQGMNVLCAPFAYAARSEVEAFVAFSNLLTYECPGYVRGAMDGVHRGVALVDRCLEIVDFKLYNYLLSKGMHARLYAFSSVLTLCACTPPLPEVLHLWDFLFAFGVHLNVVCIVAQLVSMRDSIFSSASPTNLLRSFPPLNTKKIKDLTVSLVQKIPNELYAELVNHAK
ncbi:MAG: hypothetical protein M1834_008028 [Cirrosporium novae-zelandiae]|nr:MAG: hypothetical protein M1834_008028 [Cirrosporium novae-zelandiae]